MSISSTQSGAVYEVVVNQDGKYSIWPADKALPQGWSKADKQGAKESCLEFIRDAWTDMRPFSLRVPAQSLQPE